MIFIFFLIFSEREESRGQVGVYFTVGVFWGYVLPSLLVYYIYNYFL